MPFDFRRHFRGVPARHVKAFLNRPRRDYRVWKNKTARELEERQQQLPFEPVMWRKLHLDQKACFLIGARQPRFAFFSDPSTGKTVLALALARYHRHRKNIKRVLVLVPNLSNKDEWESEMLKHCPLVERVVLRGSSPEKWRDLEAHPNALITIETYAGLTRMATDRTHNGLKANKDKVCQLRETFQAIVCDECSEVKGHDTLIFRILRQLTKPDSAHMVLLLSGTPLGRDPTDLWAQMYLVDRGETLGETLGLFRAAFFTSTPGHWGGVEHTFERKNRRRIHELLANRSIRYRVSEADLPKVSYIPKLVRLSEEAQDFYDRANEDLIVARRGHDAIKVKNTFMRMRQMSSGFVGLPGDEDGRRAKIVFESNPKLELLGSLVRSVPEAYKVIIFHEFIYSGERIAAELERLGISHVTVRGGTKDPGDALRAFRSERGPQCLVLNHKAGGFGLNLQNAGYCFFYESPVSSIIRRQTEARIQRRYSDWERIAIYDLLCTGTWDERIRVWHAAGRDLFEAIMEGRDRDLD